MSAEDDGSAVDAARFAPRIESLAPLMAFAADSFARHGLPAEWLPALQLALEELFTNMVKYGGVRREAVDIRIARLPEGVEVTLTDHDVAEFDLTQAPAVETSRPLCQREPGGLGLHLTRHVVDHLEYRYDAPRREACVAFRKTRVRGDQP